MNTLIPGTRIELLSMPQGPRPVPAGTQGEVIDSTIVCLGSDSFTQILVKWDNGRNLSCVIPPDQIKILCNTSTPKPVAS